MPDCWLIAAIKSLSVNPKGLEMLNGLISTDDKGNVTVKLKGVGKEYTISKEELVGANELADGDLDVRAIEIAIRRYFHEIGDHIGNFRKIKNMFTQPVTLYHEYESMLNGAIFISNAFCILFDPFMEEDVDINAELIEKLKTKKEHSTIVNNANNDYNVEGFINNHVYAVIKADDNYVYLSDPHNPNTNLSMTHEDFLKFFDMGFSMKY